MPLLHGYFGTPLLSALINALHSRNGTRISDCNSGFRCFERASFLEWKVKSQGMEFASELLINALQAGAKVVEVPITLRRDRSNRQPHLQTWRDGMRPCFQKGTTGGGKR